MGRILKRVPMSFNEPLEKTWKGYINPYQPATCSKCGGCGYNEDMLKLKNEWYSMDNINWVYINENQRYNSNAWAYNLDQEDIQALIDNNRLWQFTRIPINEEQRKLIKEENLSLLPFNNGYIPTVEEVNKAARNFEIFHDTINSNICIVEKAKRLGFYGICDQCNGEGHIFYDENQKELYNNWKKYEPPIGEGFQLWSTTGDGPVSPVFDTFDKLCEWCSNNYSIFAHEYINKQEWKDTLSFNPITRK